MLNRCKKNWKAHLALFALVAGPGIISANEDNDDGGIATCSVAGAVLTAAISIALVVMTVMA